MTHSTILYYSLKWTFLHRVPRKLFDERNGTIRNSFVLCRIYISDPNYAPCLTFRLFWQQHISTYFSMPLICTFPSYHFAIFRSISINKEIWTLFFLRKFFFFSINLQIPIMIIDASIHPNGFKWSRNKKSSIDFHYFFFKFIRSSFSTSLLSFSIKSCSIYTISNNFNFKRTIRDIMNHVEWEIHRLI